MSRYRAWYGMRKRLQQEGKWQKGPVHPVPAQEEGEPPTKNPRISGIDDAAGGDPEEGTSKQAQDDLRE